MAGRAARGGSSGSLLPTVFHVATRAVETRHTTKTACPRRAYDYRPRQHVGEHDAIAWRGESGQRGPRGAGGPFVRCSSGAPRWREVGAGQSGHRRIQIIRSTPTGTKMGLVGDGAPGWREGGRGEEGEVGRASIRPGRGKASPLSSGTGGQRGACGSGADASDGRDGDHHHRGLSSATTHTSSGFTHAALRRREAAPGRLPSPIARLRRGASWRLESGDWAPGRAELWLDLGGIMAATIFRCVATSRALKPCTVFVSTAQYSCQLRRQLLLPCLVAAV